MNEYRPGSFQILPTVVKNLIIINAIMAFAQFVLAERGIDLADYLGLHYWRSPLFRPWQLITHLFMHGSAYSVNMTFLHLFSNMFSLWIFGSVLENYWGAQRFLTFYLICGCGAAMLHLFVLGYEFSTFEQAFYNYRENIGLDKYNLFIQQQSLDQYELFTRFRLFWESNPACADCADKSIEFINQYRDRMLNEATVGASGAVFGILFAFGYLFPNTLLYIYFLFPIKAKYFIGLYAIFELYSGIRNSAGDNVAHFAHLGGMLVAFILLKVWKHRNRHRFF